MKALHVLLPVLLARSGVCDVASCTERFCSTANPDRPVCGAIAEGTNTPARRFESRCVASCNSVLSTGPCPEEDAPCPSGIPGCHRCATTDEHQVLARFCLMSIRFIFQRSLLVRTVHHIMLWSRALNATPRPMHVFFRVFRPTVRALDCPPSTASKLYQHMQHCKQLGSNGNGLPYSATIHCTTPVSNVYAAAID